jgi:hypothetical protein
MIKNNDGLNFEFFTIGGGFTLEEATKLMYQEVVKKENQHKPKTVERVGVVLGVLSLNDEIEVVVQFLGEMEQFVKDEFESQLVIVTNDD